ncbi:MAG TPA: hypothetical protein VK112_07630 [Fodinibius sp.]|nr:hypothetical protein [Fodinibius sp.]
MNRLKLHTTPGSYKLDEIEWVRNEKDYPIHPDYIPFKNSTKKIRKELEHLIAQID